MNPDVFDIRADGLLLRVRLTPKTARNAFQGTMDMPEGRMLKIAVNAMPEDGKANAELIRFLAKTLGIPKSAVELVSGATSREKRLKISGDPAALAALVVSLSQASR